MKKTVAFYALFAWVVMMIIGYGRADAGNVLVNIWDGTERAVIKALWDEGKLPNLKSVGDQLYNLTCNKDCFPGCEYTKCCMKTLTKPQHATMLTGVLADEHGVFSNAHYQMIPDDKTVYEEIELSDPSIKTAHISSKPENFGMATFGNILDDIDFFVAEDKANPRAAANHARRLIRKWQDQEFFIVSHFNQPDVKGHKIGVDSHKYREAILLCDMQLGRILEKLDLYGIREETKIYVLSDHGFGHPKPKNHKDAPNTFIVSNDELMAEEYIGRQTFYMDEVARYLWLNFIPE